MEIYLVGGALRDRLLGRPVRERDFLVVNATPEQMTSLGYHPVGKDFPIFLHPQTHEEYALARNARGEYGADQASLVTLEEDLSRRDITINAMAESSDGRLIDPFGGRRDLETRVLRHVSDAFTEDPIRILRVARFMARYQDLHFQVAPETLSLMRRMVDQGALNQLVAERVWQELVSTLAYLDPEPFFTTLRQCGALAKVLPELDRLWGVPQPEQWHPEIDTGVHSMMALQAACRLTDSTEVRFAALVHDLGKGLTPKEQWPSHTGHEALGAGLVTTLCQRLRVPKSYRWLAEISAQYHTHCHRLYELKAQTILKVLERMNAFRSPQRFSDFLKVCEADFMGRKGFEDRAYPQAGRFLELFRLADGVDKTSLREMPPGKAVGEALHNLRLRAVKSACKRPDQPANR